MTPQEITAHAIELGITPEAFPELWAPTGFTTSSGPIFFCTLPSPDSADPRACLWDPFYMRALGSRVWPFVGQDADGTWVIGISKGDVSKGPTPTAALRAAWLAKGAKT